MDIGTNLGNKQILNENIMLSDFENNSISEGFNSINKLQNKNLLTNIDNQSMYKVNLAAALHDHISCTKLQTNISKTDEGLIKLSLPKEDSLEFDFDDNDKHETLKDIVLVQLDLIQHQQEQLLKKERQLQSIKQDRENLFKRVDNMEKEILDLKGQLIKNKEENNFKKSDSFIELNKDTNEVCLDQLTFCNFLTDPTNVLTTNVYNNVTDNQSQNSNNSLINKSPSSSLNNSVNLTKINFPKFLNSNIKTDQTYLIDNQCDIKNETADKKKKRISKVNLDCLINKTDLSKNEEKKLNQITIKKKNSSNKKLSIVPSQVNKKLNEKSKDSIEITSDFVINLSSTIKPIETEIAYDIVTNKNFFNSLDNEDEIEPIEIKTEKKNLSSIEIPSWRLHPISSCYSLEGTENLNDEVFNRRHAKLELDEKRRKRWDMQRLREQRNNEKLRSGRYSTSKNFFNVNNNSNSENSIISSFYPPPEDIQYIEVSDTLPVVAFGHPIPELPETSFTLPWNKIDNTQLQPE